MIDLEAVSGLARIEAVKARGRYGDFTSTHEAYGVLCEEVDELLSAIRANMADEVFEESVQVASVALRLAEIVSRRDPEFMDRSSLTSAGLATERA